MGIYIHLDFRVSPDVTVMDLFDGSNLLLTCDSKGRVEMEGTIDGVPIPSSNFTYHENSTYQLPYGALYKYEHLSHYQTSAISITCISENEGSHTWKIIVRSMDLYKFDIKTI